MTELNGETLKHTADFLNILSTKECLAYQNTTWNFAIDWFAKAMKSPSNKELIAKFVDAELNELLEEASIDHSSSLTRSNKLAKLLLMLFDVNEDVVYKKPVNTLLDRLSSCNKYLYMKAYTIERCFFVFDSMLNLTKSNINLVLILKLKDDYIFK